MLTVAPADLPILRPWFAPERPGPLVFEHALRTGVGRCRVDRLPDARVVVAELPGNVALRGDPAALPPGALDGVAGFVDAPPAWLPALRAVDPGVGLWDRIISTLPADVDVPEGRALLLGPADTAALDAFDPDGAWIHETWGSAGRLAEAGLARGTFAGDRLVSVAVPFYVGDTYEDIGIATDARHRGHGFATACTRALIADIRARGRVPTWTTSPDNTASRALAARAGFVEVRTDVLYALRVPIPVS